MTGDRRPARSHVPFDALWKMRIEHPYSLLVRDGDDAWSCGQCPLDPDGRVLAPNDLPAQTRHVVGFIEQILSRQHLALTAIGKLVVYYVDVGSEPVARMIDVLRERIGSDFILVPIAIPHFYYDGMLIEIDVHAAASPLRRSSFADAATGISLEVVGGGPLVWATATATRGGDVASAALLELIAHAGLSLNDRLADHWFVDGADGATMVDAAHRRGIVADPGATVSTRLPDGCSALGELTFARPQGSAAVATTLAADVDGIAVSLRRRGRYFWISGRDTGPDRTLVEQTRAIMRAIDRSLAGAGLRFADVSKATTHYAGGSTEAELHDNMSVRNRYYAAPGPSSTGLPVMAFPLSRSLITIDLLGVV